ncbi:aminodeoxychorismate/anthranilate synthase component II [Prolixibacteraceae bacterium JC049]|nr:aminodeoxychorismate/anthranilate synthase component II [Prolixibacteraceae bacterium JC049]
MKLLIVDNHDSFTYNLVQLIEEAGCTNYQIVANEAVNIAAAAEFTHILFSPGPGLPDEFPAMKQLLEQYAPSKSFLGICLGHQAIAEFYGGQLYNLPEVVHGQVKHITQKKNDMLFSTIDNQFDVGLYHSWIVSNNHFPEELEITALSEENRIMALRHRSLNIRGVQFHPESIMTPNGLEMIKNWLSR